MKISFRKSFSVKIIRSNCLCLRTLQRSMVQKPYWRKLRITLKLFDHIKVFLCLLMDANHSKFDYFAYLKTIWSKKSFVWANQIWIFIKWGSYALQSIWDILDQFTKICGALIGSVSDYAFFLCRMLLRE